MTTAARRCESLERANVVRLDAAKARRSVRNGTLSLPEALEDPRLQPERAYRLLRAVPNIGPLKAEHVLAECGAHLHKRVGELTLRQRRVVLELAERLRRPGVLR